jgi:hypothetical protein
VYIANGVVVPGVSEILRPLVDFSRVPPALLRFACERGKAVHKAIELYNEHALDFESLDPEVVPRLHAYLDFLRESKFIPDLSEHIVHHAQHGYAGKLDLFGHFPDGSTALIDVKTGSVEAQAGYQTAAYLAALVCEFPAAVMARRYALWLGDHRYSLVPFSSARDWAVFQTQLILWKKTTRCPPKAETAS